MQRSGGTPKSLPRLPVCIPYPVPSFPICHLVFSLCAHLGLRPTTQKATQCYDRYSLSEPDSAPPTAFTLCVSRCCPAWSLSHRPGDISASQQVTLHVCPLGSVLDIVCFLVLRSKGSCPGLLGPPLPAPPVIQILGEET